ncbi:glycosyltransferase family 2 protein [Acuticoccus sp. MNP-M23]|uniref:glycosyltransferase family 2 protein n=1 Tax=Acuticoccus sp. MNP-M23 TaxID=3072793 RepID=UPI0028167E4F|nr:glycosyltransferase family 2 protein [Acuticoccus sp. MNP-M23]WMS42791.1 glycosyltransferase family 2 protein [Acuticoccus sp. MNP-M23]
MTFPKASIVVPAYNAAATLADTLRSLLAQTFQDMEIVVVNDCSTDDTLEVAAAFDDPRIRIVSQRNRGLSGARNGGIEASRGAYIGFCDADDLWLPEKLERHVAHLSANPNLGLSYAGSEMIDGAGKPLGVRQSPRLTGITAAHIFCRNPVGNGSVAVFRREALDAIRYRPRHETERDWWFDETFRQSEDIEAWMRFALTADWDIAGIDGHLTLYRVHTGGLSANIHCQFESWTRMRAKVADLSPRLDASHGDRAAAYQLRYLARRAVKMGDGAAALGLIGQSLSASTRPLLEEPVKTAVTAAAAIVLAIAGRDRFAAVEAHILSARTA